MCIFHCLQNLILQIIKSATKCSKACSVLINGYSLLPFLVNVSENIIAGNKFSIKCLEDIVNNIDNFFKQNKSKESLYQLMLKRIMLNLRPNVINSNLAEK